MRYADVKCVGIAGTSRAMSPAEMDAELVPILEALWALRAPILHYKVCSTFDSEAVKKLTEEHSIQYGGCFNP